MGVYVEPQRGRRSPSGFMRVQLVVALLVVIVLVVSRLGLPDIDLGLKPPVDSPPSEAVSSSGAITDAGITDAVTGPLTPSEPVMPIVGPTTIRAVNVHVGPSESYVVLGLLRSGTELDVVGRDQSGKWLAVTYPLRSSFTAWIPASAVSGISDITKLEVAPVVVPPIR